MAKSLRIAAFSMLGALGGCAVQPTCTPTTPAQLSENVAGPLLRSASQASWYTFVSGNVRGVVLAPGNTMSLDQTGPAISASTINNDTNKRSLVNGALNAVAGRAPEVATNQNMLPFRSLLLGLPQGAQLDQISVSDDFTLRRRTFLSTGDLNTALCVIQNHMAGGANMPHIVGVAVQNQNGDTWNMRATLSVAGQTPSSAQPARPATVGAVTQQEPPRR